MPNTQTSVPAFVAAQVLTAQQQTEINTGIPVFATTVTRDAAFGGAGEKALAEGQFAYIEATNTTQYYDGAAWQSVGITPGLVCVQAETAFTTAASVTANNVFTSSYTNYRLMIKMTGSANTSCPFVLRVGGTNATGANYNYQSFLASSTTLEGSRATNQSSFSLQIPGGAFFATAIFELFAPAVAEATIFMTQQFKNDGANTTPYSYPAIYGNHTLSTAYDGFSFSPLSGTVTGTYTIYGYSKTV
jgi:hypothetical protein